MLHVEDFQVDEAEYLVCAFVPPSRTRRPWSLRKGPLNLAVFRDAGQRLRARGFANDDTWLQAQLPGTLAPQGVWRAFLGNVNNFTGATAPHVTISDDDAGRDVEMRVFPAPGPDAGTDIGLISVERLTVPSKASDAPLDVDITWRALGIVTDSVMAEIGHLNNGRIAVRYGPGYSGGEQVDVVNGVMRTKVHNGLFGRERSVKIGQAQLARVLHEILVESQGSPG